MDLLENQEHFFIELNIFLFLTSSFCSISRPSIGSHRFALPCCQSMLNGHLIIIKDMTLPLLLCSSDQMTLWLPWSEH